jgi:hypothetical protein
MHVHVASDRRIFRGPLANYNVITFMPIILCYHGLLSVLELLSLRGPLGDKKIMLLLYNLTM